MSKRLRSLRDGQPLFDIVSYAAGQPRNLPPLTPEQLAKIHATVHRVPEVMVKVLTRSSNDFQKVAAHLDYITRKGSLELETDTGDAGKMRGRALLEDWDLDIEQLRRQSSLAARNGRRPAKIVHKLLFSMPPGTPPEKVLGAVRNLAREQFALQHRYAFALHTDELHPHVHLVLKAVSEQGVRLNIKKAHLQHWRSEFARHLRLLGVEANATSRSARGNSRESLKDEIFRAGLRGGSTYLREQSEAVARELLGGEPTLIPGSASLHAARERVVRGWSQIARRLKEEGRSELAQDVEAFVSEMAPPRTRKQWLAQELLSRARGRQGQTRTR